VASVVRYPQITNNRFEKREYILIHYQLIINPSRSLIRSIEALLFPKKLVFRVGKEAVADRQVLLQFWVVCRLVRIANVLGCVGWVSITFHSQMSLLNLF
jgi:hypothetical protein